MTTTSTMLRPTIIFGSCILLAVALGYLLATPASFTSLAFVSIFLLTICFPLLMRWHHPLLILTWNSSIVVFFLPGQLGLWVLAAGLSLFISVLNRMVSGKGTYTPVRSVVWTLCFFALVVAVTAKLTGGIGLRALGSATHGGKRYFFIFSAVIGYFALASQRIPRERAMLYASLYFLSGVTALLSILIYFAGPKFYVLFSFFPPDLTSLQGLAFAGPGSSGMVRYGGLSLAALAVCSFLQLRYGVRGLLDLTRPWRLAAYALFFVAALFGGFRSTLIYLATMFVIQFCLEGLFRTKLLPVLLAGCVVAGVVALPFLDRLPLSVQRCLTFLPLKLDPEAKADAQASSDWRVQMWKALWPEIPKYLWVGKGYAMNPTDHYFAMEGIRRGITPNYEPALIAGDYHNGPLSLILAFGIFGVAGFLAFALAALRVLYRNYRWGDPALQRINTFLFAFYLMRLLAFFTIFGSVSSDLAIFTGLAGLSVSLNGAGPSGGKPRATSVREVSQPMPPVATAAKKPG